MSALTQPAPIVAPVTRIWSDFLVIDIETVAGRPESAEEAMRRQWTPDARWTPETIGKRYLEALEKKKAKLALLDSAGIAVVALNASCGRLVLHAMGEHPRSSHDFADVIGYRDERSMLLGLREVLALWCGEHTLVAGWNLAGFDYPRLRLAFLRAGLQLPPALAGDQPRLDLMKEFCRTVSVERSEMASFEEALEKLGLPNHKALVSGAQVGELIAKGEIETVLRYAALDVVAESEVFFRLTGRSAQLQ